MLRIGVDVGGTFTDIVLWDDEKGRTFVQKLPSTPHDPSIAALEGIEQIVAEAGTTVEAIRRVSHGTTVATNVVVQHRGAKVGFITSAGYRDILHTARHKKPFSFSLFQDLPWQSDPLAPRRFRKAVPERIGPAGETIVALDEKAVEQAARELAEAGVDAIAIGFLFSFLEPKHEERAKEICEKAAPDLFVCTSSEVIPQFREYERFSTTALNAYIAPSVRGYVGKLSDSLERAGVQEGLQVMNSAGGVVSAEGARESPASLLMSGPVAGVLGGIWAGNLAGADSVITLDMGGTSVDIGVAPSGEIRMKHILDSKVGGYHTMMPMVDCEAIGAGGGSIAFVDPGGVLRVGPRSAGADPGPACYDWGGTEPTVTDAQVLLGRIRPDALLSGTLPLNAELADRAIRSSVAEPLGLSVEDAALGILEIATETTVAAIETSSIRKGLDPRDFGLVVFGGAGPLFGSEIAARLDIPRVIVPPSPGVTSALGLLTSDTVYEYGRTVMQGGGPGIDAELLARAVDGLEARATEAMERDGIPAEDRRLVRFAECRYPGQGYELRLECPDGTVGEAWVGEVARRFHDVHQREYYRAYRDVEIQIVNVRVRGAGKTVSVAWPELPARPPAEPQATHDVWFRADGKPVRIPTPFYLREELAPGQEIAGPAVVQQFESTVVVPPAVRASVDSHGLLIAETTAAEEQTPATSRGAAHV
jgi:N-methylhydantoinase A/oxoprolinase/acetone carboxylase beta subunit